MTADAPGRLGRRSGSTGTFRSATGTFRGVTGTQGTTALRRAAARDFGPFDADTRPADVPDDPAVVDFGSVRVPIPEGGTVAVEPTANGRLQAIHITLPGGRLSVSALAAPGSATLWPELAAEIQASLKDGGARVRSFTGAWGKELHATTGAATSLFIGVDGERWMLYGVATGPTRHAEELDEALRAMLRGSVVVRGRSPYPVRTVLPLTTPEDLDVAADDVPTSVPGPRRPAADAAVDTPVTQALPVSRRPRPGDGPPSPPAGR
ncbi:MAG: DUF3710 domain-containing protein, partial [Pseudonocardiales bacterium]|nr:DUF3710 domain-containing protein [Pseudonocardiales bacterium]